MVVVEFSRDETHWPYRKTGLSCPMTARRRAVTLWAWFYWRLHVICGVAVLDYWEKFIFNVSFFGLVCVLIWTLLRYLYDGSGLLETALDSVNVSVVRPLLVKFAS